MRTSITVSTGGSSCDARQVNVFIGAGKDEESYTAWVEPKAEEELFLYLKMIRSLTDEEFTELSKTILKV